MLTRILSRLRRIAPANRPATKARPRVLNFEALEAREVPATLLGLSDNNVLIRFDSSTPTTPQSTVAITGLAATERVVGIDFRPRTGQLYGLGVDNNGTGTNARLFTINALTGATTQIGTTIAVAADPAAAYGFDFNPTVDRLCPSS